MKTLIVTKNGWLSQYTNLPDWGGIVHLIVANAPNHGWVIEYR